MAEVYTNSFILKNVSPEESYSKAINVTPEVFKSFDMWKKRPTVRLFGIRQKGNDFSTINFFILNDSEGAKIELRFNTKGIPLEELESLFSQFKEAMLKQAS